MSHVLRYALRLNSALHTGARLAGIPKMQFAVKVESLQSVVQATGTWNSGRLSSNASLGAAAEHESATLSPTGIPDPGETGRKVSPACHVDQGSAKKSTVASWILRGKSTPLFPTPHHLCRIRANSCPSIYVGLLPTHDLGIME